MKLGRVCRVLVMQWRMTAMHELQYPGALLAKILVIPVSLGISLAMLAVVYENSGAIAGWTSAEMLVLLGVLHMLDGIVDTFIAPTFQELEHKDIRDGNLDFVLMRPMDAQLFVSIRKVAPWQALGIPAGAALCAVGIIGIGIVPTAWHVLLGVFFLGCGTVALHACYSIASSIAFWTIMGGTTNMLSMVSQTGKWPVWLHPLWLRFMLVLVLPYGIATTVSAEALVGRPAVNSSATLLLVSLVLAIISRKVWTLGLSRYSGASS